MEAARLEAASVSYPGFARALEAGALLLWVRAEDTARQTTAHEILSRHGAADVHVHTRPAQES